MVPKVSSWMFLLPNWLGQRVSSSFVPSSMRHCGALGRPMRVIKGRTEIDEQSRSSNPTGSVCLLSGSFAIRTNPVATA